MFSNRPLGAFPLAESSISKHVAQNTTKVNITHSRMWDNDSDGKQKKVLHTYNL